MTTETPQIPRHFMGTVEVARMLGLTPAALRAWRHRGIGPRWRKLGPKKVVYDLADISAWVDAQETGGDVISA